VDEGALRGLVEAVRGSRAPEGVQTRIVAIDGPGGSGKSTLAEWLAPKLDARIIQTDDFATWDNPIDWWPQLLELVLKPLAAGEAASYQPTSWGGTVCDPVQIEPSGTVLLEGVTSSREAFRPYLAYAIWVETPRELRLQRGLERDGADSLHRWQQWMEAEDAHITVEQPAERADAIVKGDDEL
jgi:uridine kinase